MATNSACIWCRMTPHQEGCKFDEMADIPLAERIAVAIRDAMEGKPLDVAVLAEFIADFMFRPAPSGPMLYAETTELTKAWVAGHASARSVDAIWEAYQGFHLRIEAMLEH